MLERLVDDMNAGQPHRRTRIRRLLSTAHRYKWPTIVALGLLLAATAAGWYWIWGVFFLYWAVYGIVTGQAFVVQAITREENPLLFWLVSLTWVALAVIAIVYDISPLMISESFADWLGAANE